MLAVLMTAGVLFAPRRKSDRGEPAGTPAAESSPGASAAARVAQAFAASDRSVRSARLESVWAILTPQNAPQVAEQLWALVKGSPFQNDWLEFLRRWADLDAAAAAAFVSMHEDDRQVDWMAVVLQRWVTQDAAKALAWLAVQSEEVRRRLEPETIATLAEVDRDGVEALLRERPADEVNTASQKAWAQAFARHALDDAVARLDASRLRGGGFSTLDRALFDAVAVERLRKFGVEDVAWVIKGREPTGDPDDFGAAGQQFAAEIARKFPRENADAATIEAFFAWQQQVQAASPSGRWVSSAHSLELFDAFTSRAPREAVQWLLAADSIPQRVADDMWSSVRGRLLLLGDEALRLRATQEIQARAGRTGLRLQTIDPAEEAATASEGEVAPQ